MRRSLKTQLAVLFLSVMVLVFVGEILSNAFFLERYYLRDTKKELIRIYELLEDAVTGGELEADAFQQVMKRECQTANIEMVVLDQGQEYMFSNHIDQRLKDHLFRYNLENVDRDADGYEEPRMRMETGDDNDTVIPSYREDEIQILTRTEQYSILRYSDSFTGMTHLEMLGTVDGRIPFAMRIPMESIRRSAAIAERFTLYAGLVLVLIGLLVLIMMMNRFLKPVEELTELSEHMAELDFDTRYTGGGTAEIAVLGENFNRMSSSLEKAIKDLKTANLTLQNDLEQKEKREEQRKEFLANVSHELKTPLAVIEGYAEGLMSPLGENPEKREAYCHIISDETQKMSTMLRNLLTLSELEAGAPDMERFDLKDMIRSILEANQVLAEQQEIDLQADIENAGSVWGDPMGVEQVLTNYLSNAIRYAEGDPKKIRVTVTERDGDGSGEANHGSDTKVRVNVYNTGAPIAPDQMPLIWDKFYKIDKVRSRSKGGTGIGLSIVKTIMEQHGQAYGVRNESDGVTFWFELNKD